MQEIGHRSSEGTSPGSWEVRTVVCQVQLQGAGLVSEEITRQMRTMLLAIPFAKNIRTDPVYLSS